MMILPDGAEEEIIRRGRPSPLEQRRLLRRAVALGADALVAEMMSIRPESLFVESRHLLRPHILVVTNVLSDHWEHWGTTRDGAAACLAAAVPESGVVLLPENDLLPVFQTMAAARRSRIIPVSAPPAAGRTDAGGGDVFEFPADAAMVNALAAELSLASNVVKNGLSRVRADFGALRAWRMPRSRNGRECICVSAFSANDPASSRRALSRLGRDRRLSGWKRIGLLNLRSDRADRTCQWLKAMKLGKFPVFDGLAVTGGHADLFVRRFRKSGSGIPVLRLSGRSPREWMSALEKLVPNDTVVLGLGNIAGAGGALIAEWSRKGAPYGG